MGGQLVRWGSCCGGGENERGGRGAGGPCDRKERRERERESRELGVRLGGWEGLEEVRTCRWGPVEIRGSLEIKARSLEIKEGWPRTPDRDPQAVKEALHSELPVPQALGELRDETAPVG